MRRHERREMNRRVIETSEDLVCAFIELFEECEPEHLEFIAAILSDAGYDPGEVGAEMQAVAGLALADVESEMKTAKLGMPKGYMLRCKPELVIPHLDHWREGNGKAVTVYTVEGAVIAVVTDRYAYIPNQKVIDAIGQIPNTKATSWTHSPAPSTDDQAKRAWLSARRRSLTRQAPP